MIKSKIEACERALEFMIELSKTHEDVTIIQ